MGNKENYMGNLKSIFKNLEITNMEVAEEGLEPPTRGL